MTNWTELKRLAELRKAAGWKTMDSVELETILALIAENERLRADGNDVFGLAQARADAIDQLRAEVEALRNSLRQISNEVDCNMRPLIRDLVNRTCGLDNGANPNDLYVDCDRIDDIIDSALDSNQ